MSAYQDGSGAACLYFGDPDVTNVVLLGDGLSIGAEVTNTRADLDVQGTMNCASHDVPFSRLESDGVVTVEIKANCPDVVTALFTFPIPTVD